MIIKKLEISGLRAFKQASFEFNPGMNIIIGINGVGKTTVLDALRICMSKILIKTSQNAGAAQGFDIDDIKKGLNSLQVSCDFNICNKPFNLLFNKQELDITTKETGIQRELRKKKRSREMREEKIEKGEENSIKASIINPDFEKITPDISKIFPDIKKSKEQILSIYYSTRRSLVIDQKALSSRIAPALFEALSLKRDMNIREIADWFHSKEVQGEENAIHLHHLGVLVDAVSTFLPELRNLHTIETPKGPSFRIVKEGFPLSFDQLSDGERGMLCLVLELSKRLTQANPELENPNKDGIAVVLIDEIDLHLHPQWQRTIVENLTRTFPKCQFIATTHSPQIIPSVDPEKIILIKEDEIVVPDRSFGMDSNWILSFIMDAGDRPEIAVSAISKVEKLFNAGEFTETRKTISEFKNQNLDMAEWAMYEARMARMELMKKGK